MAAERVLSQDINELALAFSNEAAFRAWYERALPRVFGYLVARCGGDRELAEELAQQTFVAAIAERHRFDGRSDSVTWLCGIARHKLADHFRRRERDERRRLQLEVREVQRQAEPWDASDDRTAIAAAMARLPAAQRGALTFAVLDGLPVREVARLMGRSEAATQSLLSRARDGFRRAYRGAEGRPDA